MRQFCNIDKLNICVSVRLGVGAYSEVYQVTRKSDGMAYALKQVRIRWLLANYFQFQAQCK